MDGSKDRLIGGRGRGGVLPVCRSVLLTQLTTHCLSAFATPASLMLSVAGEVIRLMREANLARAWTSPDHPANDLFRFKTDVDQFPSPQEAAA